MEPVVVTSPDELLSALPHVLGFHPEESVVTVPFRAGMLTARVDIPRTAEERRQAIGAVSNAYAHHARPGEMVAVICVTEDKQAAQRSSMAMATALERVGVLVPLRVWATEKRWVELNSGQAGTRTRAAATRIAAEVAFAGHTAPAANRQELADSLVGDRAPVAGLLPGARAASTISGTEAERTWAVGQPRPRCPERPQVTRPNLNRQTRRQDVGPPHRTPTELMGHRDPNNSRRALMSWRVDTKAAPQIV